MAPGAVSVSVLPAAAATSVPAVGGASSPSAPGPGVAATVDEWPDSGGAAGRQGGDDVPGERLAAGVGMVAPRVGVVRRSALFIWHLSRIISLSWAVISSLIFSFKLWTFACCCCGQLFSEPDHFLELGSY